MIYIHKLSQLSPKIADIEVIPIIRNIKDKINFPLTNESIESSFIEYYVKDENLTLMENSLRAVEILLEELMKIYNEKNQIYEQINIARAIKLVEEIPNPLKNNIEYSKNLLNRKQDIFDELFNIINLLPNTINIEDKRKLNDRINELFNHILRNRDFSFNYNDLINEVHTSHIKDLYNMIDNGFLFHVRLEEELAKTKFNVIKLRIPQELLLTSEKIKEGVLEIKQGVDKAYQINMNSINFALLLYSYIRVLHK